MVITKLYCPICGKEMCADIHPPDKFDCWYNIDSWICLREPKHHCVVFGREDIEDWLE